MACYQAQNNTDYGEENEDITTVKFETKVIKSNLCNYADAYILVTGNITATGGGANDDTILPRSQSGETSHLGGMIFLI